MFIAAKLNGPEKGTRFAPNSAHSATMAESEVSTLNRQIAEAKADRAEKEARVAAAYTQIQRGSGGADVMAALSSETIKESDLCRRLGVQYVWLAPDLQPRATPGGPRPKVLAEIQVHPLVHYPRANIPLPDAADPPGGGPVSGERPDFAMTFVTVRSMCPGGVRPPGLTGLVE